MALNWQTEYHRYQRYFGSVNHLAINKKSRVYTGIVASLFTVAFFLFFAIKPTLVTITTLNKEIKDKKVIAAQLEQKNISLAQAQKEYLAIEGDLPLIDEALPASPNTQEVIKQVEALAVRSGVELNSAKYGESLIKGKPSTVLTSLNFDTTVGGDYEELKSFLQGILSLRRVSSIDEFSFQNDKTKSGDELMANPLNLVLSFETNVYSLGENQ